MLSRPASFGATVIAISLLVACSKPDERRSDPASDGPHNMSEVVGQPTNMPALPSQDGAFTCGGTISRTVVDRWFADLESALAAAGDDHLFDNLVRQEFSVREAQGEVRRYDLASVDRVTPDIISREEWRQISITGPDQLMDAGWRGCFIDGGKIWFEASAENGFRLTSIARDLPRDKARGD